MQTVDVVVIGSGIHGLVSATVLADSGLDVLVLEQGDQIGGAIASGEVTLPGYTHDLYAMSMNLFVVSPFYAKYGEELRSHGLNFVASKHPYASAFPDGTSLRVSTDAEETALMWKQHSVEDAKGWERLGRLYSDFTQVYFPLYVQPLPSKSVVSALRAAWKVRKSTPLSELAPLMLSSTRTFGDRYFSTPEAKSMASAWGMHLDFAPDVASGALFPLLELYGNMLGGMSIVEGGAGKLPEAIAAVLRARGGSIRTGSSVTQVMTGPEGVTGVELASGEKIAARQGVVSTTPLPLLVDRLLSEQAIPASLQEAAKNYTFGPGTMMIHLALDNPIPWQDPRLADVTYVHLGPYVDDMARTYQQAKAGILPDEPLLVIGQASAIDPSRVSIPGHHTAWVEVRMLPGEITGDAAGELAGSTWDEAASSFTERILDKLERYAPGLRKHIVSSATLTPLDLERANPNLVGGDSVSGSHHQHQLFGMRPSLELARYATPIKGLYIAGAGTWPGGGVNAISGQLAAERLLRDRRAQTDGTLGGLRRNGNQILQRFRAAAQKARTTK
jgi:phytoene dehydrogenase-like protein